MNDVARRAGVSQTTVSFVLNDRPGVSIPSATRDRVWEAAESLGYRANALARSLRSSRSHTIGLVSDQIASTSYGGEMIHGAQRTALRQDVLLLLIESSGDRQIAERAVDLMLERRVDGLVHGAMYHKAIDPPPATKAVPTVLLNAFTVDGTFASVVPDDERGGFEATNLLLDLGHRRLAYLQNEEPIPASHLRLAGHRSAVAQADLSTSTIVEGVASAIGGFDAARRLLADDELPTGIVCFNDRMALGAYRALREAGLDVPGDISVVGFDNELAICEGMAPGLTTLQLPHFEMGVWAIGHLLDAIDVGSITPVQHKQHCPVVARGSVAPPAS